MSMSEDATVANANVKRLTKYERIKVIGMRAEQLARGAQPLVDPLTTPDGSKATYESPCEMAERELEAKRTPFVVVRRMPDGKPEYLRLANPTP